MKEIMIARNFLQTHPQAGMPTHFVEKIWKSLTTTKGYSEPEYFVNDVEFQGLKSIFDFEVYKTVKPKHHTIRNGKRFKDGELAQLKVWSEMPYRSSKFNIAPDVRLTVQDIEIIISQSGKFFEVRINGDKYCIIGGKKWTELSENDGLTASEMFDWFVPNRYNFKGFSGQILAWGDVKY